ncbi:Stk19 family serine/threonine-protein kinase [Aspergillus stella-maris]|uniref:Stk19 family serine/threonine-protein kinase n=1 Tax=Aspergillus stella-maris TaxID=1810926 RepID=UPI003CCDA0A0
MPLRLTSAPVSGIQKRKATNPLRPRASPFASHARSKPGARPPSGVKPAANDHEVDYGPLSDHGLSRYIPETTPVDNVLAALKHIRYGMFDELPATRAGMNSSRIAQTLNHRRLLPPLVSVAHVHTILDAPTKVEREIMELAMEGKIRRLIIPGRGNDAAGLGDCLIPTEEWEVIVKQTKLDAKLKEKFIIVLRRIGNSCAIPASTFSPSEATALFKAGLLVTSSALAKGTSSVPSLPTLITTPSTPAASRIGSTSQPPTPFETPSTPFQTTTLYLSLPNTGPYLKLLGLARTHLLKLLRKSSSGEAPLTLLRDRWDGAIESERSFSVAKRARGEFAGILPGQTSKWKNFYGMSFRWVLEECVGAGLVEVFETGSVGPGVRLL